MCFVTMCFSYILCYFFSKYSFLVCMLNSVLEHASVFYAIQYKLLLLYRVVQNNRQYINGGLLGRQWCGAFDEDEST